MKFLSLRNQLLILCALAIIIPIASLLTIQETGKLLIEQSVYSQARTARLSLQLLNSITVSETSNYRNLSATPFSRTPTIDGYASEWSTSLNGGLEVDTEIGRVNVLLAVHESQVWLLISLPQATSVATHINQADSFDFITIESSFDRWQILPSRGGQVQSISVSGKLNGLVQGFWRQGDRPQIELNMPISLLRGPIRIGGQKIINSTSVSYEIIQDTLIELPFTPIEEALSPIIALFEDSVVLVKRPNDDLVYWHNESQKRLHNRQQSGWQRVAARLVFGSPRTHIEDWQRTADLSCPSAKGYDIIYLSGSPNIYTCHRTESGWQLALIQPLGELLGVAQTTQYKGFLISILGTMGLILALLGWVAIQTIKLRSLTARVRTARPLKHLTTHQNELATLEASFERLIEEVDQHSEYLENLGARLSHELRTPVSIISSSLEHLEMRNKDISLDKFLGRAATGTAQLNQIFQAMTDARNIDSIVQGFNYEKTQLDTLLEPIIALQQQRRDDTRIQLDIKNSRPINIKPAAVAQAFTKVLANAVDFSDSNSTIYIKIRLDQKLTIIVSNTGPSIRQPIERIFESFVSERDTAKISERNLGFGLYICRRICIALGGDCSAANTKDGVQFTMTFALEND